MTLRLQRRTAAAAEGIVNIDGVFPMPSGWRGWMFDVSDENPVRLVSSGGVGARGRFSLLGGVAEVCQHPSLPLGHRSCLRAKA
jgi:hypothetical protein